MASRFGVQQAQGVADHGSRPAYSRRLAAVSVEPFAQAHTPSIQSRPVEHDLLARASTATRREGSCTVRPFRRVRRS